MIRFIHKPTMTVTTDGDLHFDNDVVARDDAAQCRLILSKDDVRIEGDTATLFQGTLLKLVGELEELKQYRSLLESARLRSQKLEAT